MAETEENDSTRTEMRRCPLCGGSAPPQLKKCMFCGSVLEESSTEEAEEIQVRRRESVDMAGAVYVAAPVMAIGVLWGAVSQMSILQSPVLTMFFLYFVVGVVQAFWTFREAFELKTGQADWRKPHVWALLVLFGWPVAVPFFLLERAKLGMKNFFILGTAACAIFALTFVLQLSSFNRQKRHVMQHARQVWAAYEQQLQAETQAKAETSAPLEKK